MRRDGSLVCARFADAEEYTALDRVFKLNLDGPSELLYDRTTQQPAVMPPQKRK